MKKLCLSIVFVLLIASISSAQVGYHRNPNSNFGQLGDLSTPQQVPQFNRKTQEDVYRAVDRYNRSVYGDDSTKYEIRRKSRDKWEIKRDPW